MRVCQLLDAAAGDGLTRLDMLLIFTFVALEELISIHAASNTHVHEGGMSSSSCCQMR